MTNIPAASTLGFIDNPHAPDIFADTATGWFLWNGNLRITFDAVRASHTANPAPINRVVICRLVLPLEQAEIMAKGILAFLETQRAQKATVGEATTIQ